MDVLLRLQMYMNERTNPTQECETENVYLNKYNLNEDLRNLMDITNVTALWWIPIDENQV